MTNTPKEHPILFSPAMMLAACKGRKTETRRVIVPQPPPGTKELAMSDCGGYCRDFPAETRDWRCPYGVPGDLLVPRSTWAVAKRWDHRKPLGLKLEQVRERFWHAGLGPKPDWAGKSRPGRYLPKTLWSLVPRFPVVGIGAEWVQDITEAGAITEGVDAVSVDDVPRQAAWSRRQDFSRLWDSINEKHGYGWTVNPAVWAIKFRRSE